MCEARVEGYRKVWWESLTFISKRVPLRPMSPLSWYGLFVCVPNSVLRLKIWFSYIIRNIRLLVSVALPTNIESGAPTLPRRASNCTPAAALLAFTFLGVLADKRFADRSRRHTRSSSKRSRIVATSKKQTRTMTQYKETSVYAAVTLSFIED